jgi:hypothetical protein
MANDLPTTSTKKEAFFRRMAKLSDVEDEPVNDRGRLASEKFLKGVKKVAQIAPSALHRGSNRNTSLQEPHQAEEVERTSRNIGPSNAEKVHRRVSAPAAAWPSTASSKGDSTKNHDQERPAPSPPKSSLKLKHTTSAPPQLLGLVGMPSSAVSKSTGKRKRVEESPMVPEGQRIFRGLSFCTASIVAFRFVTRRSD